MQVKVSNFMTTNPVTLKENTTVREAADIFICHSIDGAPVLDAQGRLCGIFTKKHLYRAVINELGSDTPVSQLMKKDVNTINQESSPETAWQLAQEQQVGRFPVTDGQGNLVAMITRTNLVQAFERRMLELESVSRELSETTAMYEELSAVINSSYDGIMVLGAKGQVIIANQAYEKMGMHIDADIIDLCQKAIQSADSVTRSLKCAGGRELLLTANPVRGKSNGEFDRVVINYRDITELNTLRREVETSKELSEIYHLELETLRTKYMGHTLVCESQAMRNILDTAIRVAKVDTTILILGESGVGKDVVTRLIHKAGRRAKQPFIRINCGAIPENLLESELFGYEPGAFTGARRDGKPGLFELAHRGTLFLDELAELPLALQVKLLNVLQEREVTRVGGVKPVEVDVRIIAATNKPLPELVKKGKFRADLYYRLSVIPITIPSLRERRSDIPALVIHFLRKLNEQYHLNKNISVDAMECLSNYSWPGNVRELENLIERLMVMSSHNTITARDLPTIFLQRVQNAASAGGKDFVSEKELIEELYQRMQSTRKVAETLGVNQSTVVRKMKKYNIKPA
ncbi:MAG: hypothetical protein VR67_02480 [Peptococcaceae bacterium BRH_c8a]|nr:MAG: hypothetical protein VR67_02480 [Peptococcaceae bacterium BRH_c8a]